jgi:REP element-mobilizing transposase RayT
MPRAHRYYLPSHVWHITHRCHQKEFSLKFARDRKCWVQWFYEARKRFGLSVLNYVVASSHIHLLVKMKIKSAVGFSGVLRLSIWLRQSAGLIWQDRWSRWPR